MYSNEIKVTKERVPVLVGKKGSVKRYIENKTHTKVKIDSKEGDVEVSGEDSYKTYTATNIVNAIGRGFNPHVAMLLLSENNILEVIDITDFSGKSKTRKITIKSRIIGRGGKARKIIENLTGTHLCIYGKTVCIIGEIEKVFIARRAVEMILLGSKHSNVYSWLERQHDKNKFDIK